MSDRTDWMARCRVALLAGGALGFVLAASTAWAETKHNKTAPHPVPQNVAAGVIVHSPPPQTHRPAPIPSARESDFAAEAAHDDAWRAYRGSTPSVTDSTVDQDKGYPGLHALAPAD